LACLTFEAKITGACGWLTLGLWRHAFSVAMAHGVAGNMWAIVLTGLAQEARLAFALAHGSALTMARTWVFLRVCGAWEQAVFAAMCLVTGTTCNLDAVLVCTHITFAVACTDPPFDGARALVLAAIAKEPIFTSAYRFAASNHACAVLGADQALSVTWAAQLTCLAAAAFTALA